MKLFSIFEDENGEQLEVADKKAREDKLDKNGGIADDLQIDYDLVYINDDITGESGTAKIPSVISKVMAKLKAVYNYLDSRITTATSGMIKSGDNVDNNIISKYTDNVSTDDFEKITPSPNYTDVKLSELSTYISSGFGKVKKAIVNINQTLGELEYSDVAGGKNKYTNDLVNNDYTRQDCKEQFIDKNSVRIETTKDGDLGQIFKDVEIEKLGIKVGDKVTFSCEFTSNKLDVEPRFYFSEVKNDGSAITSHRVNPATKSVTFTVAQNTYRIQIVFRMGQNTTDISVGDYCLFSNIQVELGEARTDYEPYIPSVKMLAEETADINSNLIDLKMLGWSAPKFSVQNSVSGNQFIQRVGRMILNGGSNYDPVITPRTNTVRVIINVDGIKAIRTQTDKIYIATNSNINTNVADYYWNKDEVGICELSNDKRSAFILSLPKSAGTDLNSVKSYMNNNPIMVYYELATQITMTIDGNEAISKINDSLGDYNSNKDLVGTYTGTNEYVLNNSITLRKAKYAVSFDVTESSGSECLFRLLNNNADIIHESKPFPVGKHEYNIELNTDNVSMLFYSNGKTTISNIRFELLDLRKEIDEIKADLGNYKTIKATTDSLGLIEVGTNINKECIIGGFSSKDSQGSSTYPIPCVIEGKWYFRILRIAYNDSVANTEITVNYISVSIM